MTGPAVSHLDVQAFRGRILRDACGFLTPKDLEALAGAPAGRLVRVLVRWHEGRALVPAQDAAGLIEAAGAGGWCVRDVSFPVEPD